MISVQKTIEILAPGGDSDSVKAAILAGADAVYCGLPEFNARLRADNISLEALRDLVFLAHQHDCRVYITLNTLILESELSRIGEILDRLRALAVDAIIVQDPGLQYLLQTRFPAMEVHASTQMTTHNIGQIAFLESLGVRQVNLCRELSLGEIAPLCNRCRAAGITTEVFVHGAYCVSFSGQCYMSSAMCGHSGNRGACVQPCRRAYRVPGRRDTVLPFNLRDNSAFSSAAELADAGVDSFKIEGRIKSATYVHTTVTAWRQQIDRYLAGRRVSADDPSLHTVFNRKFSDGYLKGRIGREMFIETSRDQSLTMLSTVAGYHADRKTLTLEKDAVIPAKSQVAIYTPDFRFICTGIVERKLAPKRYSFRIEHELKGRITGGQILYALGDPDKREELRHRIDRLTLVKKPLRIIFRGSEGRPLEATFISGSDSAEVRTDALLSRARNVALTPDVLAEKMGMLGTTAFRLESIDREAMEENLFLPLSELNELRRKGVAALSGDRTHVTVRQPAPVVSGRTARATTPRLACLVSSEDDLRLSATTAVTLLFEVPPCIGDRMDRLAGILNDHPGVVPWFGPVLIGNDFTDAIALLDRCKPSRVVSDNSGLGMEAAKRGIPWIAGPLLNCVNSLTLRCFRERAGALGAFLSSELGREQIRDIADGDIGDMEPWFSLYAPLLLMNTRQCIIGNIAACDKPAIDGNCLSSCTRRTTVTDANGNCFFIEKRPGHYTQVYNGRRYLNLDILRDLRNFFAVVVVDLRDIITGTSVRVPKERLLDLFDACIQGDRHAETELKNAISHTTAAQYERGL